MTKEFLHLAPSPEQCLVPLTNFEVADDACEFRQIPVALVIPSQLPPELRGRGSAFRVKVPEGCPMLSAAVFKGTWLSVSSLQSIASSLTGMPAIPKGTGSGVAGRVKKIDLAVQLVKHLFEDSSEEEQLRMVKGIMYQNSGSLTEKDEDILLYLEQLDSENQQAFEQVKRFAKEERTENEKMELDLIKKKLRAQRAAEKRLEQEKAEERKEDGPSAESPIRPRQPPAQPRKDESDARGPKRAHVTPKEFKDLFPVEAEGSMQYFHDPTNQVFRVSYPDSNLPGKYSVFFWLQCLLGP